MGFNQSQQVPQRTQAAQDVTSVSDPTQPNAEMGDLQNLIMNVVEGLDPTFGILTKAAGLTADRPQVGTQLMAGILGPGIPAGGAARGLDSFRALVGKGSLQDIRRLAEPENFKVFDETLSSVPTEEITDLLNRTADMKAIIDPAAEQSSRLAVDVGSIGDIVPKFDLVEQRLLSEMGSRALISGDPKAIAFLGGEELVEMIGPSVLSSTLGHTQALKELLEAAGRSQ